MAYVEEDKTGFVWKVLPLSLCFAISICLSNEAYLYCSVPFLQMCKELNVVMVYFVGLGLAVERFSVQTATILLIIMMGCCMSIHGEMRFSKTGFMFQICAQIAEVIKIITQQKIMQGFKIDPLTMVLIMSPLCLVSLSVGLVVFWEPGIVAKAEEHAFHLILNGFNAFALNIAVAVVIRFASGVSFVLAGVIKDVAIVACAAMIFGALITPIQIIGFSIAVAGVLIHSVVRSNEEKAVKHGVLRTFSSVVLGCPQLEEKYGKAERSA
jgi:drug/metabolite transporter (DMT)-like permease